MISRTSEYALRAVVHLAQRDAGPAAAQQIAAATQVPPGYLHKILRLLAKAGILVAQRGVGGGFSLARIPAAISVLDVLRATDTDIARIDHCPLKSDQCSHLCALHRMLDSHIAHTERTFAKTSIAELLAHESDPDRSGRSPRGRCPTPMDSRPPRTSMSEASINGQKESHSRH